MERDDWKSSKNLFDVLPRAGARRVNENVETFLHVAVGLRKDIQLKDKDGYTALSVVAISGTKDMAEALTMTILRQNHSSQPWKEMIGRALKTSLMSFQDQAGARRVNENVETFLHVAVRLRIEYFVFVLVKLMHPKDLQLKDKDGYMAEVKPW
ncbi:hypothetical protein FRX31_011569 [Thalictrum thalictroides]|uniref:Uncharacterized protein n=1 Tax=Thalictrum thalictroides TaxID=46969 RepID=A0A7J6WN90_THATH|nr:hypothetical protein FRX31_011569 [Thalictrum thalictroides]